jgi:hypothetical protein
VGSDWFYVVGVVGIDASEVGAVDRLVGFRRNGVNVECFREINIGRLWWLYVGVLVLFLFVCVLCGCRWSCPLVRQTWCVCWFFSSGSTSEWLHRVHVVCVDTTDDCFVSHGCPVGFTDLVLVSVIVYGSMEQVGC